MIKDLIRVVDRTSVTGSISAEDLQTVIHAVAYVEAQDPVWYAAFLGRPVKLRVVK